MLYAYICLILIVFLQTLCIYLIVCLYPCVCSPNSFINFLINRWCTSIFIWNWRQTICQWRCSVCITDKWRHLQWDVGSQWLWKFWQQTITHTEQSGMKQKHQMNGRKVIVSIQNVEIKCIMCKYTQYDIIYDVYTVWYLILWQSSVTDCPQRLRSLPLYRYSKAIWLWS